MNLFTLGHGTAPAQELAELIHRSGIEAIVDVRSIPRSRRHPQFSSEEMAVWVPQLAQCSYRWNQPLGGFRSARADSANVALRHSSFRGYADHMESAQFEEALNALLHDASARRTAVLCSESLWWRCHRRLISDAALLLHNIPVFHLFRDGKLAAHLPTQGVRVLDRRRLRYDLTDDDDSER